MYLSRLSVLLGPAVVAGLLGSTLVGIDRLAFRDVSHFYTPLYEYVGQRAAESWLPAWNPLDQTGIPLLGETTTAFFYPVRYLLFALPISAEAAMGWYVAVHLILASLAAVVAARWAGVSRQAATLSGVVYPLSGSIIGLYINPPFLVGAAWLPLAAGALLGTRPKSQAARVLVASVAMAMMVLGSDPQTALHMMIIAGGAWGVQCLLRSRLLCSRLIRSRRIWPRAMAGRWRRLGVSRADGPRLTTLIAAPLIAALLSAPQLAASLSWSHHSERLESSGHSAWWQPPRIGSQRHQAYQFSLPPWHLAGLATPTPWGSFLPQYRRLSALVPGDGRMWSFSIYPGMLASLAVLCRLARWRRGRVDRWSVLAVVGLLLSLGHFGLVWWLQNLTGLLPHIDSAFGGAYWVLYHVIPGYDLFRYPAKWLPMFSLAAAIAAAQWLDGPAWRPAARKCWTYAGLCSTVTVAAVSVTVLRISPDWIRPEQDALPADRFWGPLDIAGGLREIQFSLVHSLVMLTAIGAVVFGLSIRRTRGTERRLGSSLGTWLLIGLTTVDLTAAAIHWVKLVDVQREQALVSQVEPDSGSHRWLRTQSDGGWPQTWRTRASEQRLMEVEASQRAAWMGRWHLADGQAVLNSMTSIQSHEIESFWRAATRLAQDMPPPERSVFWQAVKRWMAIGGESHTTDRVAAVQHDGTNYELVDLHRLSDPEARSGIRFHTRWTIAGAPSTAQWTRLLEDVHRQAEAAVPRVHSEQAIAELRRAAAPPGKRQERIAPEPPANGREEPANVAEENEPPAVVHPESTGNRGHLGWFATQDGATLRVTSQSPDRVALTAITDSAGLLTRRVYQDDHWKARLKPIGAGRWQPATVYSVDNLAQGIVVPPGRWAVQFFYRPAWLWPSAAFAAVAWACWLIAIATVSWRHLR